MKNFISGRAITMNIASNYQCMRGYVKHGKHHHDWHVCMYNTYPNVCGVSSEPYIQRCIRKENLLTKTVMCIIVQMVAVLL